MGQGPRAARQHTIIIDGQTYDAISGMPISQKRQAVDTPVARSISRPTSTNHAKRAVQRSQTLHRSVVKRPASHEQSIPAKASGMAEVRTTPSVERSPMISRFGNTTNIQPTDDNRVAVSVIAKPKPASHITHHTAQPVQQHATPHTRVRETSQAKKNRLLHESLAKAPVSHEPHHVKRRPRLHTSSLVAACLAIVMFAGYLTYLNMPGLSVRVAASRAGVAATYPEYQPTGYRFAGPAAYDSGQVAITFAANGGSHKYTITQRNSMWDSRAVLDNLVSRETDDYITHSEQGMTVYTYKGQAAWVNAGTLYTLEGNAPLSNRQILDIAASM